MSGNPTRDDDEEDKVLSSAATKEEFFWSLLPSSLLPLPAPDFDEFLHRLPYTEKTLFLSGKRNRRRRRWKMGLPSCNQDVEKRREGGGRREEERRDRNIKRRNFRVPSLTSLSHIKKKKERKKEWQHGAPRPLSVSFTFSRSSFLSLHPTPKMRFRWCDMNYSRKMWTHLSIWVRHKKNWQICHYKFPRVTKRTDGAFF